MRVSKSLLGAAVAAFVPLSVASAQLGFASAGPVDPANGFPTSYTDANALVLGPCLTDLNFCGLDVAPTVVDGALAFPANYGGTFPEEFFYNRCVGKMTVANGGVASVVIALEGAFANGTVVAGEQMVFGRLRIRVTSGLVPGATYNVTTPVGVYTFVADGGGRILMTDDVGLVPGLFSGPGSALTSHVGPFLRWDTDLPLFDLQGREYVGTPLIDHTITGSPTGTNFFRIDGPSTGGPGVNSVQTNLFAVTGLKQAGVTPPPPPTPPVAAFTSAPNSGTAPLNVAFTDTSTGTITSWLWSFGDGATSTLQNPTHSFAAGTFSVSLTVAGPAGSNVLSQANLIAVTEAPPPPVGLTLANPLPGLANVANTLVLTGCQPNAVVGLYTGQVLGASIVRNSRCPLGIPIGLGSPFRSLGTVRANAQGVATFTTTPPRTSSGRLFHFQAVEPATCSTSNLVSDVL